MEGKIDFRRIWTLNAKPKEMLQRILWHFFQLYVPAKYWVDIINYFVSPQNVWLLLEAIIISLDMGWDDGSIIWTLGLIEAIAIDQDI